MSNSSKTKSFNENYWAEVIKRPDWYMEFVPRFKKIQEDLGDSTKELGKFRKTVRQFFEKALEDGRVALADQGPNLDEHREPIDTIVIHHTSARPGYSLSYMNATQLLNIYAPYFMDPTVRGERGLKGTPVWSNHFKNGKQIFWIYHWLMRMDGNFERLLEDDQIGWHAGNWGINKRSVGICLDNDYEGQAPTDEILQKLAIHIKQNYPEVKTSNIIGHCEANPQTICPGAHFLDRWKPKLLAYLNRA